MPDIKSHIVALDGSANSGRKTFAFELALALLYNNKKTAFLLSNDSPLRKTLSNRPTNLITPDIINKEEFYIKANNYDAIIIPELTATDEIALTTKTFITMQTHTKNSLDYINTIWELKKKIASRYNRSLDWIICENNLKEKIIDNPSKELSSISRMYGFRVSPPLNKRKAYQNNYQGLSAQDKNCLELRDLLTYDDICAKREVIKLAEFIFS